MRHKFMLSAYLLLYLEFGFCAKMSGFPRACHMGPIKVSGNDYDENGNDSEAIEPST